MRTGLVMQWISALALLFAGGVMSITFKRFDVALPTVTIMALWLSQATILFPMAAITSVAVIILQRALKSEQSRHIVQTINSCLWLGFTSFVLVALSYPFMLADNSTG